MTLALHDIRNLLDGYPERMAVGEVNDLEMAVRYTGRDKLHLAFNFDLLRQPWHPRAFQKAILDYLSLLSEDARPCFVLGNHDTDRFPTRFGGGTHSDARTKVAATLLLTQRGTPFIYYGEEIGMQNTHIPLNEIQDPPGKRYWPFYRQRDPERTPMQWNGEANAGFTSGAPWLRLNRDYHERNVTTQQADPNSVLNFYKLLLKLRKESIALRQGSFKTLIEQPTKALAYLRQAPEQALLVALNFYHRSVKVKIDETLPEANWELRLTSTPGDKHPRLLGSQLSLAPFEACVLERVKA
jgi:alpha-glucosidase